MSFLNYNSFLFPSSLQSKAVKIIGISSGDNSFTPQASSTNTISETFISIKQCFGFGKCVRTIGFFVWLLLNDKLNTRNVLKRKKKHLDEGYSCVLCRDSVE
jgi:hypothetical protein